MESGEAVSRLASTAVAARPIVFSPDGQRLVARDPQRRIRIFDLATETEMGGLPRTMQFRGVAFSPDGKLLASTDSQGNVRLWLWQPDDLIIAACQHLTRNFTSEEWQQYFGDEPYRPTCDNLPAQ